MNKICKTLTAALTAGSLSLAATNAAVAAENNSFESKNTMTASIEVGAELNQKELEYALATIEQIPDSALESEEAFSAWKDNYLSNLTQPRASVGGCAWEITKALAANIFIFSKVTKLKTVIKGAGGAKAVASKAKKAYDAARKAGKSKNEAIAAASRSIEAHGGEQAASLLLELFSVDGVVTGCFTD